MPWTTPSLRDLRSMVRDQVSSALATATIPKERILSVLNATTQVGNSILRIVGDAQAGLAHLTLQFIRWVSLQLMPDTAETEWLDRHGIIWLTNADGTLGRKPATFASAAADITGAPFIIVAQGIRLTSANGGEYEVTEQVRLNAAGESKINVRSLLPGTAYNRQVGDELSFVEAIAGIDGDAVITDQSPGTDEEDDESLRQRVLDRIRQPPMGGDENDYIQWTMKVSGVTRAWSYPQEMGIGTVTVRFMMDDLREDNDGFPLGEDVEAVTAYLDTVRPVTVKDFFVVAPIPYPITITVTGLEADTPTTRANIETAIAEMIARRAKPGQTIYASWINEAISSAVGENHHTVSMDDDIVMPNVGSMPHLFAVIYE